MLWDSHTKYREMTAFTTLDELLTEHVSYREGFDELREEYSKNGYEQFLVSLGWSDLPFRYATKKIIESSGPLPENAYAEAFLRQFRDLNTDKSAFFLFPESVVPQFFVIMEVCKNAVSVRPVKNLFPDETKVHYLAVFDKENREDVLLMYHLLYTNASQEVFGGYSLYDYSLPWYQTHLRQDDVVFRSPYLPDLTARFQGNLPFYHNPSKTVYVRRNIDHMLESGYFTSELDCFLCLTTKIMPLFQWWYEDLSLYAEEDGAGTDWRLRRTKRNGNMSFPCFRLYTGVIPIPCISTVPPGLPGRASISIFPHAGRPLNTRVSSITCRYRSTAGRKRCWKGGNWMSRRNACVRKMRCA